MAAKKKKSPVTLQLCKVRNTDYMKAKNEVSVKRKRCLSRKGCYDRRKKKIGKMHKLRQR